MDIYINEDSLKKVTQHTKGYKPLQIAVKTILNYVKKGGCLYIKRKRPDNLQDAILKINSLTDLHKWEQIL